MSLRSCLYERQGGTKKREWMIKERKKPLSFFIELLLEHVTVNKTGAFGIPPDKGNRGQYFSYTLPFYNNQFIRKQSWHVKCLMLTQARGNRGAGSGWDAAPSPTTFLQMLTFYQLKITTKRKK